QPAWGAAGAARPAAPALLLRFLSRASVADLDQFQHGSMALRHPFLTDQPFLAVVPHLVGNIPQHTVMSTILLLAQHLDFLHTDVVQLAVALLAVVTPQQRHALVSVLRGRQLPEAGGP